MCSPVSWHTVEMKCIRHHELTPTLVFTSRQLVQSSSLCLHSKLPSSKREISAAEWQRCHDHKRTDIGKCSWARPRSSWEHHPALLPLARPRLLKERTQLLHKAFQKKRGIYRGCWGYSLFIFKGWRTLLQLMVIKFLKELPNGIFNEAFQSL